MKRTGRFSTTPPSRGKDSRAVCCGIALFFVGLYLLVSGQGFYSTDGETMARTTWAMVDKGRLSVPCDDALPSAIEGREGRCYSRYGLGQPLAAVPLYLVGKGASALFPDLDYGQVLRFTLARFNQFVMALACGAVCALGALLYRSTRMGAGLALLFGLSTLALPYSRFYFNEPLTVLGLAMALLGLFSYRQKMRRNWLWLGGAGFGLAVLTRTVSALLLPAFLAYLWSLEQGDQAGSNPQLTLPRAPGNLFAIASGRAVCFLLPVAMLSALQVAYQWWAFGNPWSGGYRGEGWQTPLWLGLYGLLLSPGKSLLLFTPLTLLSGWGWARWVREGWRREAVFFAASFLLWLLFHAGWWTWHGGWSWGPRFMVPMLPFLILPIGSLWRLGRGPRTAIIILAAIGFAVQLGGLLVNFGDYMLWVNDEDKVLFNPAFTPLVGHWRMLLTGARPDLAVLNMPVWGAAAWATVCGLLMALGLHWSSILPAAGRTETREEAAHEGPR